jgi:hypothetical protein
VGRGPNGKRIDLGVMLLIWICFKEFEFETKVILDSNQGDVFKGFEFNSRL